MGLWEWVAVVVVVLDTVTGDLFPDVEGDEGGGEEDEL